MKKTSIFRLTFAVLFVVFASSFLFGCEPEKAKPRDSDIVGIAIASERGSTYILGDPNMNFDGVTVRLARADGGFEPVPFDESAMLTPEERAKFSAVGRHTAVVRHLGFECLYEFDVVNPEEKGEHVVAFLSRGGTRVPTRSATVVEALPETTREGYAFDGWYSEVEFDENDGEKVKSWGVRAVEPVRIGKTTVFYAKWLDNRICKARFFDFLLDPDESNATAPEKALLTLDVHYGERIDCDSIEYPGEARQGYEFAGWNVLNGDAENVREDLNIRAQCEVLKCVVEIEYAPDASKSETKNIRLEKNLGDVIKVGPETSFSAPHKEGHKARFVFEIDGDPESRRNVADGRVKVTAAKTRIYPVFDILKFEIIIYNGKEKQDARDLRAGYEPFSDAGIKLVKTYEDAEIKKNFTVDWDSDFALTEHTQNPDVSSPARLVDDNGSDGYEREWCFRGRVKDGENAKPALINRFGQVWDAEAERFLPAEYADGDSAASWGLLDERDRRIATIETRKAGGKTGIKIAKIRGNVELRPLYRKKIFRVRLRRGDDTLMTFKAKYLSELNIYDRDCYLVSDYVPIDSGSRPADWNSGPSDKYCAKAADGASYALAAEYEPEKEYRLFGEPRAYDAAPEGFPTGYYVRSSGTAYSPAPASFSPGAEYCVASEPVEGVPSDWNSEPSDKYFAKDANGAFALAPAFAEGGEYYAKDPTEEGYEIGDSLREKAMIDRYNPALTHSRAGLTEFPSDWSSDAGATAESPSDKYFAKREDGTYELASSFEPGTEYYAENRLEELYLKENADPETKKRAKHLYLTPESDGVEDWIVEWYDAPGFLPESKKDFSDPNTRVSVGKDGIGLFCKDTDLRRYEIRLHYDYDFEEGRYKTIRNPVLGQQYYAEKEQISVPTSLESAYLDVNGVTCEYKFCGWYDTPFGTYLATGHEGLKIPQSAHLSRASSANFYAHYAAETRFRLSVVDRTQSVAYIGKPDYADQRVNENTVVYDLPAGATVSSDMLYKGRVGATGNAEKVGQSFYDDFMTRRFYDERYAFSAEGSVTKYLTDALFPGAAAFEPVKLKSALEAMREALKAFRADYSDSIRDIHAHDYRYGDYSFYLDFAKSGPGAMNDIADAYSKLRLEGGLGEHIRAALIKFEDPSVSPFAEVGSFDARPDDWTSEPNPTDASPSDRYWVRNDDGTCALAQSFAPGATYEIPVVERFFAWKIDEFVAKYMKFLRAFRLGGFEEKHCGFSGISPSATDDDAKIASIVSSLSGLGRVEALTHIVGQYASFLEKFETEPSAVFSPKYVDSAAPLNEACGYGAGDDGEETKYEFSGWYVDEKYAKPFKIYNFDGRYANDAYTPLANFPDGYFEKGADGAPVPAEGPKPAVGKIYFLAGGEPAVKPGDVGQTDIRFTHPFALKENLTLYAKWTDLTLGTEGLAYEEVMLSDGESAYVLIDFANSEQFEKEGYGGETVELERGIDGKYRGATKAGKTVCAERSGDDITIEWDGREMRCVFATEGSKRFEYKQKALELRLVEDARYANDEETPLDDFPRGYFERDAQGKFMPVPESKTQPVVGKTYYRSVSGDASDARVASMRVRLDGKPMAVSLDDGFDYVSEDKSTRLAKNQPDAPPGTIYVKKDIVGIESEMSFPLALGNDSRIAHCCEALTLRAGEKYVPAPKFAPGAEYFVQEPDGSHRSVGALSECPPDWGDGDEGASDAYFVKERDGDNMILRENGVELKMRYSYSDGDARHYFNVAGSGEELVVRNANEIEFKLGQSWGAKYRRSDMTGDEDSQTETYYKAIFIERADAGELFENGKRTDFERSGAIYKCVDLNAEKTVTVSVTAGRGLRIEESDNPSATREYWHSKTVYDYSIAKEPLALTLRRDGTARMGETELTRSDSDPAKFESSDGEICAEIFGDSVIARRNGAYSSYVMRFDPSPDSDSGRVECEYAPSAAHFARFRFAVLPGGKAEFSTHSDFYCVTTDDAGNPPSSISASDATEVKIPASIAKYAECTEEARDAAQDWQSRHFEYRILIDGRYDGAGPEFDPNRTYYKLVELPVIGIARDALRRYHSLVKKVSIPLNLKFVEEGAFAECEIEEFARSKPKAGETQENFVVLDSIERRGIAIYQMDSCEYASIIGKAGMREYVPARAHTVAGYAIDSDRFGYALLPGTKHIGAYAFAGALSLRRLSGVESVETLGAAALKNVPNFSSFGGFEPAAISPAQSALLPNFPIGYFVENASGEFDPVPRDCAEPEPGAAYFWLPNFPNGYFARTGDGTADSPYEYVPATSDSSGADLHRGVAALPASLTSIGAECFSDCAKALCSVVVADGSCLRRVGKNAFANTHWLAAQKGIRALLFKNASGVESGIILDARGWANEYNPDITEICSDPDVYPPDEYPDGQECVVMSNTLGSGEAAVLRIEIKDGRPLVVMASIGFDVAYVVEDAFSGLDARKYEFKSVGEIGDGAFRDNSSLKLIVISEPHGSEPAVLGADLFAGGSDSRIDFRFSSEEAKSAIAGESGWPDYAEKINFVIQST